ncbi:MAG: hypothetical protein WB493_10160, partial [Anaeromyxobacteraceae bacterium]
MRPRVDARVVSALLAVADAVAGEVLATTPSLRSRKDGERHACEAEFTSHARALAAAVDLRSPGVFRAHVRWASRLHVASGLPPGSVGACLRVLAGRVEGVDLPADARAWLLRSLQAGLSAAEEPVDSGPVDVWDAATAALRGDRDTCLAAVDDWQRARGTRIALLGADTPAVQLAVACVERKPALVGIGVFT